MLLSGPGSRNLQSSYSLCIVHLPGCHSVWVVGGIAASTYMDEPCLEAVPDQLHAQPNVLISDYTSSDGP